MVPLGLGIPFFRAYLSRNHFKDLNTYAVILIKIKLVDLFTFSGQSTEDNQKQRAIIRMKILDLELGR